MTAMALVVTVAVGSGGATSINFNAIPQTGKTLLLLASVRTNDNSGGTTLRFNGSSSNYTNRILQGTGTSVSSYNNLTTSAYLGDMSNAQNTANTFGNLAFTVPNYTSSSVFKRYSLDAVAENSASQAPLFIITGRWSDTSAITSISITTQNAGQAFVQHSSFSLYLIN